MLLDRERECARLNGLVSLARAGTSAAVVVAGEAGIGKTSLLEHAVGQAHGMRVLRPWGLSRSKTCPLRDWPTC